MSFSKINELLATRKTKEERFQQLAELVPSFLDGKKIYYQETFYVRYDNDTETVYAGSDKYPKETKVNSAFPYIFYIAGINGAKCFATIYNESEELKKEKNYSLDENGFVVLKDFGVISQDSLIKSILEPKEELDTKETNETDESIIQTTLDIIEEEIKADEKSAKKEKKKTVSKKSKKKTQKKEEK